jgi:hypothetical protein
MQRWDPTCLPLELHQKSFSLKHPFVPSEGKQDRCYGLKAKHPHRLVWTLGPSWWHYFGRWWNFGRVLSGGSGPLGCAFEGRIFSRSLPVFASCAPWGEKPPPTCSFHNEVPLKHMGPSSHWRERWAKISPTFPKLFMSGVLSQRHKSN